MALSRPGHLDESFHFLNLFRRDDLGFNAFNRRFHELPGLPGYPINNELGKTPASLYPRRFVSAIQRAHVRHILIGPRFKQG